MDFKEAIKAHALWKIRLSDYVTVKDGSLKPSEIAKDDQCVLGKWLYGEGTEFKDLSEYKSLQEAHATFHKKAAEIVEKIHSNENFDKASWLGPKSEYDEISLETIQHIMTIQRKTNGSDF